MNVADSEVVASVMQMAGYEVCESLDEADAVFLNTCSVRDNAEQKIINRLEFLHSMKRKGRRLIVGVLGCMAERVKEDLLERHHADIVAGPDAYLSLPDLILQVEAGHKAINVELSTTETYKDVIPQRICGPHISGFVSIMRGCNNFCHYCIVPYTRGLRTQSGCREHTRGSSRPEVERIQGSDTIGTERQFIPLRMRRTHGDIPGTPAHGGARGRGNEGKVHHIPPEGHERRYAPCDCGRTKCVPPYPPARAKRKQPHTETDEPEIHARMVP